MWSDNPDKMHTGSEHPEEELAAFALNALDDAEFQAVFHHVIRCPHCQEVLLGFQDTAGRLAAAAPPTKLPAGLKQRVLANAVGRTGPPNAGRRIGPDPRWSVKRLRRWLAPVTIGALSLLLVASIGVMLSQQQEIDTLTAAQDEMAAQHETVALASASAAVAAMSPAHQPAPSEETPTMIQQPPSIVDSGAPLARAAGAPNLPRNTSRAAGAAETAAQTEGGAESVDLVKKEVSDMVEATVLSAQPETEKLPMTSPMGIEPTARGLLMLHPSGKRGVVMVSGMPADSYQIWLVRGDERMMIDRIVVNENDGSGVKELEFDESVFGFQEVALMPDERHGPTAPTGEAFLAARIVVGPPAPPSIWRGR